MNITFLGSGTGIPHPRRASPGILVESAKTRIMLDSGPGILRQLAKLKLTSHDIPYIFYTHFHPDHTIELMTFLFTARYQIINPGGKLTAATKQFINRRKTGFRTAPLTIVGPKGLKTFYQRLLKLYYNWTVPTTYRLTLKEVLESSFKIPARPFGPRPDGTVGRGSGGDNLKVTTSEMLHQKYSVGYRIEDAKGKSVVYSGDTEYCPNIVQLGRGADVLILEGSAPDEAAMPYHLSPSTAGRIAREAQPKRLILTHLYPLCDEHDMVKEVKRAWPGRVELASDLKKVSL